ncbi:MAG: hypothetical protein JWN90_237 [Parcubacteria group bacterium]|nr:hypothetical protein [Parcubacteria group bacterium]
MSHEMNHEGEHKHDHHHGPHSYWSSWCSPVGLGLFFLTTALAAAIALYTILNLIGAIMTLSHPAQSQSYTYPSDMQAPAETTGSATMTQ